MKLCFECGSYADCQHHVVPKSRGGKKTVALCGECHGKSHHTARNMNTSTLTQAALAAKRAKGERVGEIPFGWRDEDGRLVAVEEEQKVLAYIIESRELGMSLRQIANTLNERGILTKKGRSTWYAATIKSILDQRNRGLPRGAFSK